MCGARDALAVTANESLAGMDIAAFAETGGALIVGAVSLRAAVSAYSFAGRRARFAKFETDYLEKFETLAASLLKKNETEKEQRTPSWNGKRKFRIARREYVNQKKDICSFYLVPYDNRPLPPFSPGQFLTFELRIPGQQQPVTRCYSLSDAPTDRRYYRLSIKQLDAPAEAPDGTPPGLSSTYFHDHLSDGEIVEAYAPAGEFCLDQASGRPVVLIAGGSGIAPIMSMLNWLVSSKSKREIWLFYGIRNRSEHAMYDHLRLIVQRHSNIRMLVAYSQPGRRCQKGIDYQLKGHISAEHIRLVVKDRACEYYICGPGQMMDSMSQGLKAHGVPLADIRFESFGPASAGAVDSEGGETLQAGAQTFNVMFARSGKSVKWTPAAGSLLELAEDNGVKTRFACRQGICGTCVARIRNGKVGYTRKPGKEPDAGSCYPCIAQPKSDVTLDI